MTWRKAFILGIGTVGLVALALACGPSPSGATQFRQVLADTIRETDPTPSPDGKWLAYTMGSTGGPTSIYVMPIGGGPSRQLTHEPDSARAMTPTWMPDSKSILYVSTRGKQYNAWKIPLEGGEPKQMTRGPGGSRFAVPSPDGQHIVFPSSRLDPTSLYGYQLYIMGSKGELDGDAARQITSLPGSPGHPTWSPDGKWIAFVSKDVDTTKTVTISPGMTSKKNSIFATFRVFKMRPEGGKPIQLTGLEPSEERDEDVWPTWSPDGKWIAVAKRVDQKTDVWLVDPDGKRPAFPVTTGGNCSKPTWSADSKEIWYTTFEKGKEDVWVASDITIPPPPPPAPEKKPPTFKPVTSGTHGTVKVPAKTPAKAPAKSTTTKKTTSKSTTGTKR